MKNFNLNSNRLINYFNLKNCQYRFYSRNYSINNLNLFQDNNKLEKSISSKQVDDYLNQLQSLSLKNTKFNYYQHFQRLNEKTSELYPEKEVNKQICSQFGRFLSFLSSSLQCKRILELGTFVGYSTTWLYHGLENIHPNGDFKLITCDKDIKSLELAREFFKKLPNGDKIEIFEGNALDCLSSFNPVDKLDLIFIDANKKKYQLYYDHILENNLLSDRGIIVVDNGLVCTSFDPDVANHPKPKSISAALHKFNQYVLSDSRVNVTILPYFDGVMLIHKN